MTFSSLYKTPATVVEMVLNSTLEERVTVLEIQVTDIREDITEIDEDVTAVTQNVEDLDENVDFLFDEQVIQDERLLGLENRVLNAESNVDGRTHL